MFLFGDTSDRIHFIEQDIDLGDAKPIKERFYRVNADKRKCLDAEVKAHTHRERENLHSIQLYTIINNRLGLWLICSMKEDVRLNKCLKIKEKPNLLISNVSCRSLYSTL